MYGFSSAVLAQAHGTHLANQFMGGMYKEEVFIDGPRALELSGALRTWCQIYVYLAADSFKRGKPGFALFPKLHACHHVAWQMSREVGIAGHCMNPASLACSMDEDFIGRLAAVSRCVSPRLIALRCLQRYRVHIQLLWSRGGAQPVAGQMVKKRREKKRR